MTKTTARSRAEMRRLDDMPSQLAALETITLTVSARLPPCCFAMTPNVPVVLPAV